MKVTVDIDCTPEEARHFLGLPDLSSVHAAYVEKMQKLVHDGVTPEAMAEMIKNWGSFNEAGISAWSSMLGQIGGKK